MPTVVTCLRTHLLLAALSSPPHVPYTPPVFSGTTSPINYVPSNPCLRVFFWGNLARDTLAYPQLARFTLCSFQGLTSSPWAYATPRVLPSRVHSLPLWGAGPGFSSGSGHFRALLSMLEEFLLSLAALCADFSLSRGVGPSCRQQTY